MTVQKVLWMIVFVAVLALISCATAGKQFDRTHISDIKTGVQDNNQIRNWFGSPSQLQSITGSPAGCVDRWIYVHAYTSFGGAKSKSASLIVDFDMNGKVCDHAYVEQ